MSFLDNTEQCGQLEYLNVGLVSGLLVNKSFISETLGLYHQRVDAIAVCQLGELYTIYTHPKDREVVKE